MSTSFLLYYVHGNQNKVACSSALAGTLVRLDSYVRCEMPKSILTSGIQWMLLVLIAAEFACGQDDTTAEPTVRLKPSVQSTSPARAEKKKPNAKVAKQKRSNESSQVGEQKEEDENPIATTGITLFAPRKMEMQFGMRFLANDNWCTELHGTIPFPLNWPEQTVNVLSSEIPDRVRCVHRDLPIGVKQGACARQLVIDFDQLGANQQLDLLVNVEIEKSFINAPPDTTVFVIPSKLTKELNWFMGSSPYIDIELGEIKRVAKQIAADNPPNAWAQVEHLYDWVRDNIHYRNGPVRKIVDALKDKEGDCEEMTSIFVALCRASKIPARCVWIPEHCYPEFYLEDTQGIGHWFPCQAAGERQFGQMHDYRPILQKGDRFKVPEFNAPQRYVSQFFSCKPRSTTPLAREPSIEPVLDLGPLREELEALRQQTEPPSTPSTK